MNLRSHPWSVGVCGHRMLVRGAALLEVIIALALFVATAAVVTSALSSSLDSLDRQRLNTHAANLAASVLAELQLGIRSAGGTGPQMLEAPYQDWTWEASIAPAETETGEGGGLSRVEVVIRHKEKPVVRRLAQVLSLGGAARSPLGEPGGRTP